MQQYLQSSTTDEKAAQTRQVQLRDSRSPKHTIALLECDQLHNMTHKFLDTEAANMSPNTHTKLFSMIGTGTIETICQSDYSAESVSQC